MRGSPSSEVLSRPTWPLTCTQQSLGAFPVPGGGAAGRETHGLPRQGLPAVSSGGEWPQQAGQGGQQSPRPHRNGTPTVLRFFSLWPPSRKRRLTQGLWSGVCLHSSGRNRHSFLTRRDASVLPSSSCGSEGQRAFPAFPSLQPSPWTVPPSRQRGNVQGSHPLPPAPQLVAGVGAD